MLSCTLLFLGAMIVNAEEIIPSDITPPPPLLDITNVKDVKQEEGNSEVATMIMPSIHVTDATINNGAEKITGTITVKNLDKVGMGGLSYQIFLLGKLEAQKDSGEAMFFDDAPTYDNVISNDTFYIEGNSEKKLDFSYNIPSVPKGEYRLRLQILTSKGWRLGWMDKDVSVGNADAEFALLQPQTIVVPVTKEEAASDNGINVAPNSDIKLNYIIKNTGKTPLTLTPQLKVWEFYRNRTLINTNSGEAIMVPAGKTQYLSFDTKTAGKPESYFSELTMLGKDNKVSSNTLSYRWVVTGESAEITTTKVEKIVYGNGEILPITINIIGAADRKTQIKGFVSATVNDSGTESGTEKTDIIDIGNSARVAKLNVRLSRTVDNPKVIVKIISSNGTVLDEDTISLPTRPKNNIINTTTNNITPETKETLPKNSIWFVIATGILICIAIIAYVVTILRKKSSLKKYTVILLMILVGVTAVGLHIAKAERHVSSDWVLGGDGYRRWELYCYGAYDRADWCNGNLDTIYFNNSPIMGATYYGKVNSANPNSAFRVPISGYVSLLACQNSVNDSRLSGMNSADQNWRLWKSWHFRKNCGGPHTGCRVTDTISGFADFPSTTTNAWLQTWADEWYKEGRSDWRRWLQFHRVDFRLAGAPKVDLKVNNSNGPLSLTPTSGTISVTPSWSSVSDAASCLASSTPISSWSGSKVVAGGTGSVVLNASTNYTLTLTCTGPTGLIGADSVVVKVGAAPIPAPTVTLNSNAPLIPPISGTPTVTSGTQVSLNWSSTNTTSCSTATNFTASGTGVTGSGIDTPLNMGTNPIPKTYIIKCRGLDGMDVPASTTVTVNPASTLSCSLTSSASAYVGTDVNFTATGGDGVYSLVFTPGQGGSSKPGSPLTAIFSLSGSKDVKVQDSTGAVSLNNCSPNVFVNNRIVPGDVREL